MACFLRLSHYMRQGVIIPTMSRRPANAEQDSATASRRFVTDGVWRLFAPSADGKQALRMRRYFAAAATSLLALGVLHACYLYGALPSDAFVQISVVIVAAILGFF